MKSKEFIRESGEGQYNILRQLSNAASAKCDAANEVLNTFPKGANGLTPDDVKRDPEWQKAKKEFNQALQKCDILTV